MTASLPGYFNVQAFTDAGALAASYRLYTLAAGTSTHKAAYTEATGTTPHTYTSDGSGGQYIALNARGELPAPLFLAAGAYDITLKTPLGATVWTRRAKGVEDTAPSSASVSIADAGGYFTATDLEGVLQEIGADLSRGVLFAADYASLAAASAAAATAGKGLMLTPGNYPVAGNLTITVPVHGGYSPGVRIIPAAGVTVTFNGGFSGAIRQYFDTTAAGSAIAFLPATTPAGYAEWWGATPNVDTAGAKTANVAAINAAVVALTKTELLPADYYTDDKIYHYVRGHSLIGANCHSFGGTQGFVTNIYCSSPTSTMLQVGPDAYPGSVNALPQGIHVADIQLRRSVRPTIVSACTGLKLQFAMKATIERVFSTESIFGFQFYNTVACRVDKCESRRSLVGVGTSGTDVWYGYYINGDNSGAGWGLPGGNASLYLTYCSASCNEAGLQASGSSGFYLDQQYTDVFMSWCEAGDCLVGINLQGNSATGTSFGNTDVHVSRCIIDTCRLFGVFIKNQAAAGTIDIEGLYCAPSSSASSGSTAAIYIQDSNGSTFINGGQLLLGVSTVGRGIVVDNSSGVHVVGTQITEATAPPIFFSASRDCNIRPVINNAGVTGGVAVQLTGACASNFFAPTIKGKAGAFTKGIDVTGTGDVRSEYSVTGVNSSCIVGGSANKLVRNAVQITATGLSGTNLVSGVMT